VTLGAGTATGAFANAPRVEAPFGRRPCEVAANEPAGLYRLVEADDPSGPSPAPGQFYMLAAQAGWGGESGRPHLARAFSVCRVRGSRLAFLVDAIGPGTEILAALAPGARLWLAGPLGAGFTAPAPGTGALLAGGGVGLAPLVALADALAVEGCDWQAVLGFRSAAHAAAATLLPADAALATDDGSAGHHGLVTELLADELERDGAREVYACGPPGMLEAVRALCEERAVPAQLALEEAMACGFGACFGCVVATRSGYRRICVDGPVLPAAELDPAWLEHSA
jgi:NAD(P)H-flavin reductase